MSPANAGSPAPHRAHGPAYAKTGLTGTPACPNDLQARPQALRTLESRRTAGEGDSVRAEARRGTERRGAQRNWVFVHSHIGESDGGWAVGRRQPFGGNRCGVCPQERTGVMPPPRLRDFERLSPLTYQSDHSAILEAIIARPSAPAERPPPFAIAEAKTAARTDVQALAQRQSWLTTLIILRSASLRLTPRLCVSPLAQKPPYSPHDPAALSCVYARNPRRKTSHRRRP